MDFFDSFDSFLNPGKGNDNAQKQLDKYYGQSQGYLDPYNQHGQDQYQTLLDYINSYKDPSKLLSDWSNSYQESDYAKNQEQIAQEHGLNAASAMGLGGSNTALNAIQGATSQIGMQDKENYLKKLMDEYYKGAGLASGVYGIGANAAGQQSQNANQMGENSAANSIAQWNAQGQVIPGIGKLIGQMAGGGAGGSLWDLFGGQGKLDVPTFGG